MKLIVLSLALVLAGCSTPEQRAERAIRTYGPFCERLGHQPESEGWRNCIIQTYNADAADRAARAAAYNAVRPR